MPQKIITIPLGARVCRIAPGFKLVSEIEEELGGIAALASRLAEGRWRTAELVTLVHILLEAAGRTADYLELGNDMIAEGLAGYAAAARDFLNWILEGEKQ